MASLLHTRRDFSLLEYHTMYYGLNRCCKIFPTRLGSEIISSGRNYYWKPTEYYRHDNNNNNHNVHPRSETRIFRVCLCSCIVESQMLCLTPTWLPTSYVLLQQRPYLHRVIMKIMILINIIIMPLNSRYNIIIPIYLSLRCRTRTYSFNLFWQDFRFFRSMIIRYRIHAVV